MLINNNLRQRLFQQQQQKNQYFEVQVDLLSALLHSLET